MSKVPKMFIESKSTFHSDPKLGKEGQFNELQVKVELLPEHKK